MFPVTSSATGGGAAGCGSGGRGGAVVAQAARRRTSGRRESGFIGRILPQRRRRFGGLSPNCFLHMHRTGYIERSGGGHLRADEKTSFRCMRGLILIDRLA
jgi:hypothetical protein